MNDTDTTMWPKFRLILDGTTIGGHIEKGDSGLRPFRSADACIAEWRLNSLVAGFSGEWRIEDETGHVIAGSREEERDEAARLEGPYDDYDERN